jgi:hypothetical protein
VRDAELQPGGYQGTVVRTPDAIADRLEVTIDGFDGERPFEAAWLPRVADAMPVEGDACLVVLDDLGDAWALLENVAIVPGAGGGSGILSGVGPPAGALGEPGDFYIDTAADAVYGPKTIGGWGAATSMIGPVGPQGDTGPAGSNAWADITGKPATFAPSAHTHPQADVDGLGAALAAKQDAATAATDADLEAHRADTTAVHGIADTAALVLTTDPRLSDARAPTAHTHDDRYYTEAEVDGFIAGRASDAELAAHEADTTGVHGIADTALLILEGDARLADARAPTAHTHDDRYYTEAEADAKYALVGAPAAAVATHEAAGNPHPQYALDTDLGLYLPSSLVDAKGDLLVGTAADAVARKAVGSDGQVLIADSSQADGLRWGAAPAGAQNYPWVTLMQAHVNLSAAALGTYVGNELVTEDTISTGSGYQWVLQRIDPADYALSDKTMVMRVVATFLQNAVANAAAARYTAGLYPVTPAGATTTFVPTFGAVVAGSTAAGPGGGAGAQIPASNDSRVVSSTFNAPAADTFALAVALTGAAGAGGLKVSMRLEYSYT